MSDLHLETEPANSESQFGARPPAALAQIQAATDVAPPDVPAWDLLGVEGAGLFLSPAHLSVLELLIASLLGGMPLVALTGPAGVGKTTLVQAVLPLLTERSLHVVWIEHPDGEKLSLDRLLGAVLGMPDDAVLSEDDAARACEALLLPPNGKRATVAVIDSAHMLQPDAVRMLAMLSNQAGLTGHAAQMLFVARNELFDALHDDAPGGLLARITTRLTMEPYSEQEARGFIERRLGSPAAGNGGRNSEGGTAGLVLSNSALRDILQRGGGLPGRIVASLDAVTGAARQRGRRRVTARMARHALATPAAAAPSRRRLGVGAARVAAILALAVLAFGGWVGVARYTGRGINPVAGPGKPQAGAFVAAATVAAPIAKPSADTDASQLQGANPAADPGKPPVNSASASVPATTPVARPPADSDASKRQRAGEQLASVATAAIVGRPAGKTAPPQATSDADAEDRAPATLAVAREAPGPTQPAVPIAAGAPLSESVQTALRQRGDAMLAVGDVSAARRLYERAADAGSGEAAAAAGKTYDPNILALIGAVGIRPDPDAAASWYRRAVALGDHKAAQWLKELGAPAR